MKKLALFLFAIVLNLNVYGSEEVVIDSDNILLDSSNIEVYKGLYNPKTPPVKLNTASVNLPNIEGQTYSLRIRLKAQSPYKQFVIYSPISTFDSVTFYELTSNGLSLIGYAGREVTRKDKLINDPYPSIHVNLMDGKTREYVIHFNSSNQYVIPLQIASKSEYNKLILFRNVIFGAFVGILFCMFFYNVILFGLTKDKNYTFYLPYLLCVTLAQIGLLGIDDVILQQSNTSNLFIYLGSSLSGVFGALFAIRFLELRTKPKWMRYLIFVGIFLYVLVALFYLANELSIGYQLIQIAGLTSVVGLLLVSIILTVQGNKRAQQYLYAWSVLLISLVFYFLKDIGAIAPNNYSTFAFAIGVVIEIVFLSLVLANQINIYKKQKEEADKRVISEIKKNEELVINQNVILEKKVKERTAELEQALSSLKTTQSQLVQSEKMASLGVLTAGIAHEINNPINFVSANVTPLKENIEVLTKLIKEYKGVNLANPQPDLQRIEEMEKEHEMDYLLKETDLLLDGIEEGARRTHAIVDGLKTFSRGDGGELSLADVNKGILSTLSVLKSKLNGIEVQLHLDKSLPLIYCQIGKLNQVFLNIINNAIDALEEKNGPNSSLSSIEISSYVDMDKNLTIKIKDNGSGISETKKEKLFEPFYTTKVVGKGTGLGLAISYGIIEEHKGHLSFESEQGKGTEFTIILPQSKT